MKLRVIIFTFLSCLLLHSFRAGDLAAKSTQFWANMCESCHNGNTAPDVQWIQKKYGTVNEFVNAVREKGNRCMNILKNNKTLIDKVAEEIGIKDNQS